MDCKIKKFLKTGMSAFSLAALLWILTGCASNTMAVKETKKPVNKSVNAKLITQISTTENSEASTVSIKGNQLLTYTSVKQLFPLGVLLYFPETGLENIDANYTPDSDIVASIKASELITEGHASKVEISLKKDVSYEVARENNGIKILFKKVD